MQRVGVDKLRSTGHRKAYTQESILVSEQTDKASATKIQYDAQLDIVNV